jgi:hypothetical protein
MAGVGDEGAPRDAGGSAILRPNNDVRPSRPGFPQFGTKTRDELRGFESRLRAHPGYQEHVRLQAFAHSLNTVFHRNRLKLLTPLQAVSSSLDLALKLVPGVDPAVGSELNAEMIQRLQNDVAATMTLVDHSRRLVRERRGRVVDEFGTRKTTLLTNPEIRSCRY